MNYDEGLFPCIASNYKMPDWGKSLYFNKPYDYFLKKGIGQFPNCIHELAQRAFERNPFF